MHTVFFFLKYLCGTCFLGHEAPPIRTLCQCCFISPLAPFVGFNVLPKVWFRLKIHGEDGVQKVLFHQYYWLIGTTSTSRLSVTLQAVVSVEVQVVQTYERLEYRTRLSRV